MPVSDQPPFVSYTAAGIGPYAVPFATRAAADLVVQGRTAAGVSTVLAWRLTGAGVQLLEPPASGVTTIVITRQTPREQPVALRDQAPVPAATLEGAFDRQMLALQELALADRSALRAPVGEVLQPLPSAASRAGAVLAFDGSGNPMAATGVAGAPATAFGSQLIAEASADGARVLMRVVDGPLAPERGAMPRKSHPSYAYWSPLAAMPGSLGTPNGTWALNDALGRPALNEAWIRASVRRIVLDYRITTIVVAQTEFGSFGFIRPTGTDSWPAPLATTPATAPVQWWRTWLPADMTEVHDLDIVGIIANECSRLGAACIIGTSRHGDLPLVNDWQLVEIGTRPSSTITVPTGLTGTQTITADASTWIAGNVGFVIRPTSGAGRAVITAFGAANSVTVNITEAFTSPNYAPEAWRMTLADPMLGGLTVQQRRDRWQNAERKLVRWIYERYGQERSFVGIFCAQEPDGLQAIGPLLAGLHTTGGADPPILSYRTASGEPMQFWVSPASPIDLRLPDQAVLRSSIVAGRVTHLVEQDTIGTGSNRVTGVPAGPAGFATTLDQLYADHLVYEQILSGTGVVLGAHMELWEHADWVNYRWPFPAATSRLADQWRWGMAVPHMAGIYQAVGYTSDPAATLQPPVSTAWCADFRARAQAIDAWLVERARQAGSARAMARQVHAVETHTDAWSSLGGVATRPLPTVRPRQLSSEAVVQIFVKFGRTGAAGAATGYIDVSLVIDGVEQLPRLRTMTDDDRDGGVMIARRIRLVGNPVTVGLRVDNMQIAPTVASASLAATYTELS